MRKKLLMTLFLMVCSLAVIAQQTEIKEVPLQPTSAASGKVMFNSYCAVCHGTDGKGGGPAAAALKVPPADLTLLSQKNGERFPAAHVASVLSGKPNWWRTVIRKCQFGDHCSAA